VRARPGGAERIPDSREAAERALEGLKRLVGQFFEPDRPYTSRTAPQFVHDRHGDYDHLARVFEWSTSGEDEEG
jgi:ATP-dependent helicase/nuclease subunit B